MSPDPFVHLHVASGHSLQYGATHPHQLVQRAVEQEMDVLALTDRDGTYGAVKFARACLSAGVRPVLGVELAVRRTVPALAGTTADHPGRPSRSRTPVRGGAYRDLPGEQGGLPRVTFLAQAAGPGGGRGGWAALCRLVSAVHLAGERGRPIADLDLIAPWLATGDLVVLLGPASELGEAVTRRRDDLAAAALAPWRGLLPAENLQVELVSHRLPGRQGIWGPGSSAHAARTAALARRHGLGTVLTNAVRYADRRDAPVVDVLDAARRLVALDLRHVDRRNAEGYLKSGKEMHEVAEEIARLAGMGESEREATRLLARTRAVAERCALDPRADLGLGEVHFPEFELASGADANVPRSVAADQLLRQRCEGALGDRYGSAPRQRIWKRLDDELELIRGLGYASYFLTVGDVTDLIREMGVRCAARGSGAGSLVNYLLGVSGVDPLEHGLLMERFLSPLRQALPDIDVDVESARRLEIYAAILDRYGGERCVCVSMMDSYRVRHAVRDVGAALGMPPGETDAIAKAFPHIRARDARNALRELPELRASGLGEDRLRLFFVLVERLDGLPRHIAVHPCGVLLSDGTLLDRTPVEASFAGFPMSQFDKDDVEDLGLLKLDVLGIRMQSSMAHALEQIRLVDGVEIDLDDREQVPFDDPETFAMISSAQTLGVFQIESPGQRELVGKSGIESFSDIITDISLFRPGPVKSDMITPYLEVKQGWRAPAYLHEELRPILGDTHGVVVFHEQVIELIAHFAGISNAEADEKRRALGDVDGMAETKAWFFPRALGRGYPLPVVERLWEVLAAFASFGFCKAHAAAFALPTYQSAWLKAHWPAHFISGVLTHDPGMYPKRLILDDARHLGIEILPLDVNASGESYRVERIGPGYGIRLSLADVKGISAAEIDRIVTGRAEGGAAYRSLTDFWHRARVSRPIVERLVLTGAFDSAYDIGQPLSVRRRDAVTRRDLLLQVAELDRHARALDRAARGRGLAGRRVSVRPAQERAQQAEARNNTDPLTREGTERPERHVFGDAGVWARASAQSRASAPPPVIDSVQLTLDLGDGPRDGEVSGLPELTAEERMKAELEILGLDASRHVVDSFAPFLQELGVVRSVDLLRQRSRAEVLVAGVKVATQTPPIRSGRRVIFLTLDDATGPVDATFFEDAQGPYAATVFHSWLLVVRGEIRRTGHRGISLRATGCWELGELADLAGRDGMAAVRDFMARVPEGFAGVGDPDPEHPGVSEQAVQGAAGSRSSRPVMAPPDLGSVGAAEPQRGAAGGMGRRRVLVHSSGFKVSPYADIRPAGVPAASAGDLARDLGNHHQRPAPPNPAPRNPAPGNPAPPAPRNPAGPGDSEVPRRLWHRSPGSPG